MTLKPNIQEVLCLLVDDGARSTNSIVVKTRAARGTVVRKRRALDDILAQNPGMSRREAAKTLVLVHRTRRDKARPDYQAVDDALDRGESLRSAHRRYRAEQGKKALGFAHFARLCRVQRGGTSLKCVRRSHTRAGRWDKSSPIPMGGPTAPPASSRPLTTEVRV